MIDDFKRLTEAIYKSLKFPSNIGPLYRTMDHSPLLFDSVLSISSLPSLDSSFGSILLGTFCSLMLVKHEICDVRALMSLFS